MSVDFPKSTFTEGRPLFFCAKHEDEGNGTVKLYKDHINLLERDADDLAAKESQISHIISDPLLTPTYDLKNYYRAQILTS